ncbi:unnamed protein product [Onchocerca flexuosa]|uniref:Uncharacterized protein n=1 Tax=Onchocerca flexuosa TaxID=387005 RepID=A0A183H2K6_9BILA|nr:unnamed protein product [Onchocerca flexuosa]
MLQSLISRKRILQNATSSDESGIRTHASEETGALNQRLRPLGHLALGNFFHSALYNSLNTNSNSRNILTRVGFEPTSPKRLVPKTSALDHSAISP